MDLLTLLHNLYMAILHFSLQVIGDGYLKLFSYSNNILHFFPDIRIVMKKNEMPQQQTDSAQLFSGCYIGYLWLTVA